MEKEFNYKSVHEYLDEVFQGKEHVSHRDVKVAKRKYWRMYNTALKRRRRAEYDEITLSFSKAEVMKLKRKLNLESKLSASLKQLILDFLESGSLTIVNHIDTSAIENELFLITEYLEQILEEMIPIETTTIKAFMKQIKSFEQSLAN